MRHAGNIIGFATEGCVPPTWTEAKKAGAQAPGLSSFGRSFLTTALAHGLQGSGLAQRPEEADLRRRARLIPSRPMPNSAREAGSGTGVWVATTGEKAKMRSL